MANGRNRNQIIDETTDDYIQNLDLDNPPTPEEIAVQLVEQIEDAVTLENALRAQGAKIKPIDSLSFDQIALLMNALYPIARICCAGSNADMKYDLLGIYMSDGYDEGTYVTSEDNFYQIAMRFNRRMTSKDFNEILIRLRALSPRKFRNCDKDLIAVNNGIFNYATKELMPFSPDYVFLTKSHVDYVPTATNVVIHNDEDGTDWDVESWMDGLSDDPEIVDLLWQILGAIIRPHVRWNKSAWLYSESGNNGKGTLCELMRSLCGDTAYASIPISDFGKDFMLEPLTRSTAIIVDENDVGTFIDKAANLKAVITNDVISINRKFATPISYQFYGFMVQCLNEFPRIKDKSDSFYRRQLFIPFEKCFTGKERPYIKNDYLHRDEVLQYVMFKVLNMNYYHLSEPDGCIKVLEEYKEYNDPIRQFYLEMEDCFQWDLLPFKFLYELYKSWFRKNSPSGQIQGSHKFIQELLNVIKTDNKWICTDKTQSVRSAGKMDNPEPLIEIYDLSDWKNPTYMGDDVSLRCKPALQTHYRGLQRNTPVGVPISIDTDSDNAQLSDDGGDAL